MFAHHGQHAGQQCRRNNEDMEEGLVGKEGLVVKEGLVFGSEVLKDAKETM